MIRAVVFADDTPAALANSLADLVAGAVEGVVKRVAVAAPAGAEEPLFEVADDAGASFQRIAGSFGERGLAACRAGDWLMLLQAGARLPLNWHAAAADHLRRRPDDAAAFMGEKAGMLGGRPLLALLAPRALYERSGGFKPADADIRPLLRRLGRSGKVARL